MKHKHLFHFLLFRRSSETKSLYFLISLKSFALALISIFIPIYLYTLGFSLRWIAVFCLIYFSFAFLFVFVSGYLFNRLGIKKNILIANFILIASYLFLAFIPVSRVYFYGAAVLMGIYQSLFWINFHTDMADNLKRKNLADGIGTLNIIASLISAIAPFFGYLIASTNFPTLFFISAGVILVSVIPLFFSKGCQEKGRFEVKETFKLINPRRLLAGIGVGGEYVMAAFFWPVFLFMIVSFKGIGIYTSIVLVISALFTFIVAKLIDKFGPNKILKPSVVINALHWPFRLIKSLAVFWYIASAFLDAFSKMPYTVKTYKVGKKGMEINAIASKEMTLHLGKIMACILVLIAPSFVMVFIAAAIFSFIQLFFGFEKEGKEI